MCDKLPYNNPRIDKCLVKEIEEINKGGTYRTIISCCGHGVYPKTIVVKDKLTGFIKEYYSGIYLGSRKRKRYYKKDSKGLYYIPEVMEELKPKICIFCGKSIDNKEWKFSQLGPDHKGYAHYVCYKVRIYIV